MNNRKHILILAVFVLVFLVAFFVVYSLDESDEDPFTPTFSTHYSDDFGLQALYRFLEKSGYDLDKNYISFDDVEDYEGNNYVFMAPVESFTPDEVESLMWYVEDGSHAIVSFRNYNNFLKDRGIGLTNVEDGSAYIRGDINLKPVIPDPLFYDLDSLEYVRSEHPEFFAINQINSSFAYHFRSDTLSMVPLLEDQYGGIHFAWIKHGYGKIWLISNPYIFSNKGLKVKGNAELVISLFDRIREENRNAFVFDEFHQGFHMEKVATPMNTVEVRYMIWGLLLTFLFAILSLGKRHMRAVPVLDAKRRTIAEFVASMAFIYDKKEGSKYLYREILSRFFARINQKLRLGKLHPLKNAKTVLAGAGRIWGENEKSHLQEIILLIKKRKGKKEEELKIIKLVREFSIRNKLDIHV